LHTVGNRSLDLKVRAGRTRGSPGLIASSAAIGDRQRKELVLHLIDELGFDRVQVSGLYDH
jgi:hypothetical protein